MNNLPTVRASDWLNKVPEVTLSFWIIKIMSTTVGETGADFLAVNAGFGQGLTRTVMAALLAGLACGAPVASMRETVRNFKGVEHRLEFVADINGVRFYNDSKATNVDAAIKCLEAFPATDPKSVIVILGGKDKGSDYAPLAPLVRERCAQVILIGAAADKIAAALGDAAPLLRAATMADAVAQGLAAGAPGSIVLLAPACASFDMFDNYEHRGRVFKDAVRQLAAEK